MDGEYQVTTLPIYLYSSCNIATNIKIQRDWSYHLHCTGSHEILIPTPTPILLHPVSFLVKGLCMAVLRAYIWDPLFSWLLVTLAVVFYQTKALLGTIIAVIGGVVALILFVIIALRRKRYRLHDELAIQILGFLNVASSEIRWENEGSVQTLIEMENLFTAAAHSHPNLCYYLENQHTILTQSRYSCNWGETNRLHDIAHIWSQSCPTQVYGSNELLFPLPSSCKAYPTWQNHFESISHLQIWFCLQSISELWLILPLEL